MANTELLPELHADVETLWAYHDRGDQPRHCDVGIGLGSHDLGVAIHTTSGRNRVARTNVAMNVLSGSSAGAISASATTKAVRFTPGL